MGGDKARWVGLGRPDSQGGGREEREPKSLGKSA